jgi:tight adherence protein B
LALAFAGISLGIWSLGSIMAAGDGTLEGLLSRYADGRSEVTEGEVEELIVQSALLKRAISFGEAFAEKRGFLVRAEDLLERANLPIRAGEAMFVLAAITVLTSILGLAITRSFLAALLLAVFAVSFSFFVVKFLGRRRFKKFESLLPDTLQLLAGTLRAGYSLPQGMEVVSREIADPMGQELRRAMTEARLGRELEECLTGVAERMSSADFAWAVMAISIQREVGGNLNELLMSVSDTMIARERLKREVGALTAEGRMSAGILSFLPPGLGLIMWIMNPGYIALLFTELIGNVFLGLGTVSALVGLAWMKKVITIDV